MSVQPTAVLFKDYVPSGEVPLDTFVVSTGQDKIDPAALKDGEVLGYAAGPFTPGQPLTSGGVGVIRASRSSSFKEAEVVTGMMPWATHLVLGDKQQASLQRIEPQLLGKVPLSYFLGVLGMPGLTAFVGLKQIAEPKEGEVALVSAAAGAVGLVACQLLKHVYGCKVIGSAGSDDKVKLLQEVGVDYAFNYKTHSKNEALDKALTALSAKGIDIYFENVGGPVLDKVLQIANNHARIVACGMVSQYNLPDDEKYGVKNLIQLVGKRIKICGFIVGDFMSDAELMHEFQTKMTQNVLEGKVKVTEHVTEGIENAGCAFLELFTGANEGKAVVKVAKEDPFPVKAASA